MRKLIRLCAILLALSLLLCACTAGMEKDKGSVVSTAGSSADPVTDTKTDSSGQSTDGTQKQDASVVLNTEKDFEKFLRDNGWYMRALGCTFEKPEDISAKFYFYLGVGANEQATGDELAFILDAYKTKNPNSGNEDYAYNYMRLPVAKMNEALSILGVNVEDIKIPEHWAYYDKTDAYYFWVSDAYGVTGWSVTKVEKGEDGLVAVFWETKDSHFNTSANEFYPKGTTKMVMTMQLQPDSTYRVLSNLPQE